MPGSASLRPRAVLSRRLQHQDCAGRAVRDVRQSGPSVVAEGAGVAVPGRKECRSRAIPGDADIGAGTNLGAATITANYDGTSKHRTTIGSGVQTSVDTTLVAPVTLGDEARTAAGSVITEDVPPGALGIARERQTNIEGYADRRRKSS